MSRISSLSYSALALVFAAAPAFAQEPAAEAQPAKADMWIQNFAKAKQAAASAKLPMLVDFTGSDWCGWCIKLDEEVFSQEAFKSFAKESLVLVKLDYPRDKSILPEGIEEQNNKLKLKYPISGYPTIMLMDAEGRPFAQMGYEQGGAESYVSSVKSNLEKLATRNEHMAAAQGAEGVDKAKHLKSALEVVGDEFAGEFYQPVIAAMLKADADDSLEIAAHYNEVMAEAKKAQAMRAQEAELQVVAEALQGKLAPMMQAGDTDGALKTIDEYMAEKKPAGLGKQMCLFFKGMINMQAGDTVSGRALLVEAYEISKEGPLGAQISQMLKQIPETPAGGEEAGGEEGGESGTGGGK